MKVGTIVRGKPKPNEFGVKSYIPGSPNKDSLIGHKMGLFASSSDTIELWLPESICGMIVKIDSDISGYGPKIAQVLLERRIIWFLLEDLERVPKPNEQQIR